MRIASVRGGCPVPSAVERPHRDYGPSLPASLWTDFPHARDPPRMNCHWAGWSAPLPPPAPPTPASERRPGCSATTRSECVAKFSEHLHTAPPRPPSTPATSPPPTPPRSRFLPPLKTHTRP